MLVYPSALQTREPLSSFLTKIEGYPWTPGFAASQRMPIE
jgi:hypothetical protein